MYTWYIWFLWGEGDRYAWRAYLFNTVVLHERINTYLGSSGRSK